MAPDLDPGVERLLESPEAGAEARLLVGVEEPSDEVRERLVAAGASVHDELPLDYYSVTVPEKRLAELCALDVVTSVALDGEGPTFDSDFQSSRGGCYRPTWWTLRG